MIRAFKYLSFLNVGYIITKNNRGIKVKDKQEQKEFGYIIT